MVALYKDPEGNWVLKSTTAGTTTTEKGGKNETFQTGINGSDDSEQTIKKLLEKIKQLETEIVKQGNTYHMLMHCLTIDIYTGP